MESFKTTAIILAAGMGTRMGSRIPKQFLELDGYPVLYYSLKDNHKIYEKDGL